jgi:hypothetical protein
LALTAAPARLPSEQALGLGVTGVCRIMILVHRNDECREDLGNTQTGPKWVSKGRSKSNISAFSLPVGLSTHQCHRTLRMLSF